MYRRGKRHRKFVNIALTIVCVVAFIALGTLLYIHDKEEKLQQARYEQMAREDREDREKKEASSNITLIQDNASFFDNSEAKEIISSEKMCEIAHFVSGYYNKASVSFSLDKINVENYSENDLNMLVFSAYSEENAEAIVVRIGTEASKYFISKEKASNITCLHLKLLYKLILVFYLFLNVQI